MRRAWLSWAAAVAVLIGVHLAARGAATAQEAISATPPRLGLIEGEVSFWRPGAEDWAPARLNTALAPGDLLYASDEARFELQVGAAAFVRADALTELGLTGLESGFMQLRVTTGRVSLDLRRFDGTIEVNTPNAALTVERPGYYRVEVDQETTAVVVRGDGRAMLTSAEGDSFELESGARAVIEGTSRARTSMTAAGELDEWDGWNQGRSDRILNSESARRLPPEVYGAEELDRSGDWRRVPDYDWVWVPRVEPAWVPYSAGRWMWDAYYGWTWVDRAAWGWAPFHYGRWVYVGSYWAWAPGPIVRPVYAPALVAFFDIGPSVHFSVAGPGIGWVALGWGEPLIPWWGPVGFVGVPCWTGWGGPRIVNHLVVHHTSLVHAHHIRRYEHAHRHHAVVGAPHDHFRHGAVRHARRLHGQEIPHLRPFRGKLAISPARGSLVAAEGRGRRPPRSVHERTVVASRPAQDPSWRLKQAGIQSSGNGQAARQRLVPLQRERRQAGSIRGPEQRGAPAAVPPPHPAKERRAERQLRWGDQASPNLQPRSRSSAPPRASHPARTRRADRQERRDGAPSGAGGELGPPQDAHPARNRRIERRQSQQSIDRAARPGASDGAAPRSGSGHSAPPASRPRMRERPRFSQEGSTAPPRRFAPRMERQRPERRDPAASSGATSFRGGPAPGSAASPRSGLGSSPVYRAAPAAPHRAMPPSVHRQSRVGSGGARWAGSARSPAGAAHGGAARAIGRARH